MASGSGTDHRHLHGLYSSIEAIRLASGGSTDHRHPQGPWVSTQFDGSTDHKSSTHPLVIAQTMDANIASGAAQTIGWWWGGVKKFHSGKRKLSISGILLLLRARVICS